MNGFSPNLICALTLWRSGLELRMGRFRQFLTELSVRHTSYFSFRKITRVIISGFIPNVAYALILWRSGLR